MSKTLIIGSGPSGVAAAYVLIQKGEEVVMLDVGIQVESHLQPLLAKRPFEEKAFLEQVYRQRAVVKDKNGKLPAKMPFGSDFAFTSIPEASLDLHPKTAPVFSLARGGLSNAWGANISAFSGKDLRGWPIRAADLDPYYKRVSEFVDYSADDDAIDTLYTSKISSVDHFDLGPQGRHVHEIIKKNSDQLKTRGVFAGRAKIAVGKRYSSAGAGCVNCGQCMHGCAFDAIFNAAFVLRELIGKPGFTYVPQTLALKFSENPTGVLVHVKNLQFGNISTVQGDRLLIGAGTLRSTALVARSLGLTDHAFEIKDSQKYLFPFFTDEGVSGAIETRANTLAQIFIQVPQMESTSHTVHAQLYGYNDLILDPLRGILGTHAERIPGLARRWFERLMIGMVYLHSDDSGTMQYRVSANGEKLGAITGNVSKKSDYVYREFLKTLKKSRDLLGGAPSGLIHERNLPGGSQHFGGSLPMSESPSKYETDAMGRPYGCKRVHLIDSSVFTTVPGVPTTFSVMANAARIADQIGT